MALSFQKAKREKIWVKVLLSGPSGSGKSYTGLRMATGIYQKVGGEGIAVVDTENGRIRYYANEFDFFDIQLQEPYEPEKYIEAIDAAVDNGFKVLLIDSISHEWKYLNDTHDKMPGSNSWANWGKLKPRHSKFMEKILQSPIHLIVTARGRDEYAIEEKNGKKTPKKIGVGAEQEKSIEYNYTVSFNIDQETHVASVAKDNTHLFEGRYDVLTEKDGQNLAMWATSGEGEMPKPVVKPEPSVVNIDGALNSLKELFSSKMASGVDKEELYNIVSKYHTSKNFMTIKDINVVNAIKEEMENK